MIAFIDSAGRLNKDLMRETILGEMQSLKNQLYPFFTHDPQGFIDRLHDAIALQPLEKAMPLKKVASQLMALPEFITEFIQTALDSRERLDFFIEVKASELIDSDQKHAYYWAQMIRHDQLLATFLVLSDVVALMHTWSAMPIKKVLSSRLFLSYSQQTIEDRIYLKATHLSRERENRV